MTSSLPQDHGILGGCRILVVEDFAPLTRLLEKALHDAGADIVGPAETLSDAGRLASANEGLSAALLDVRLRDGEEIWPVAQILADENVPFVFYTGQIDATTLHDDWADRPVVTKPATVKSIIDALANVVADR
jgi:DNA-binding NtrC family response regulator